MEDKVISRAEANELLKQTNSAATQVKQENATGEKPYNGIPLNPTYTRQIEYLGQVFDRESPTGWTYQPQKVNATFKELSRIDRTQSRFSMAITRLMRKFDRIELNDGRQRVDIPDEELYELTERYLDEMSIFTDQYTEQHKNEIKADTGAMYVFMFWLANEKIAPFFSALQQM